MSKFKTGDLVKAVWCRQCAARDCKHIEIFGGNPTRINTSFSGLYTLEGDNDCDWNDSELELSQENNRRSVRMSGRRTFKLIVNIPNVKKGALFQEKCDDGDQDYVLLDKSYQKHHYQNEDGGREMQPREAVEKEPKFFVEVFSVTNDYMTKEELAEWKAFQAKRGGKVVDSLSAGERTRRAKISAAAKKRWAAKRTAQVPSVFAADSRRSIAMKRAWRRRKAAQRG